MLKPNTYPEGSSPTLSVPEEDQCPACLGREDGLLQGQVPSHADQRQLRGQDRRQPRRRFAAAVQQLRRTVDSGCNVGAKNTTLMKLRPRRLEPRRGDLLPVSRAPRRADRRRQVGRLLPARWRPDAEAFDAPLQFITGDIVVLGAGTLGSTELLLPLEGQRSRRLRSDRKALHRQRRTSSVSRTTPTPRSTASATATIRSARCCRSDRASPA